MTFGGTAVYMDDVPAVLDFSRWAFGFETRCCDEAVFLRRSSDA
jgi:hypothetical protein